MSIWLNLVLLFLIIGTIVVVITDNQHPFKTLAWLLVLIFLPVAGLVLYFFFGIDKRSRRLVADADLYDYKTNLKLIEDSIVSPEQRPQDKDLIHLLLFANHAHALQGNAVKPYFDFDTFFEDMLADIEQATDHIHIQFFKIEDDAYGLRLEKALLRKVQQGVKVRIQYDDAVNISRRLFFHRLRKEGMEVDAFLKIVIPFISSDTNYRNHRKNVIIDGKVGYTGGMNIAERYAKGVHGGPWRDTHVRIQGPAVQEMQTAFLVDWEFSRKEHLNEPRYFPPIRPAGDTTVQIATSGPMDEYRVNMLAVAQMINQARNYIYIQSPYFIPTEPLITALRSAALRGVDVRLMIPYRGDNGIVVPLASRSYVSGVMKAGVKVYFWRKGYLHSKAVVADDQVCTIGSTNMDIRSYEQDFEINAYIYDPDIAVCCRDHFLLDQENCNLAQLDKWLKRPFYKRFIESLARLLSPLL